MLFLTILATAVATAAAAQLFIILKDQWLLGREGKFSLLYAALFLEQFADSCSTLLGEKESFEASDGHHGIDHGGLPTLPEFPQEVDWRHVGIKLTEDAFALRVELNAAQAKISYLYDIDPPDGGDLDVKVETIAFGLRAIDLASRMRTAAKLGTASSAKREYSAERYLRERRTYYHEAHIRYLAAQRNSLRALGEFAPTATPGSSSK